MTSLVILLCHRRHNPAIYEPVGSYHVNPLIPVVMEMLEDPISLSIVRTSHTKVEIEVVLFLRKNVRYE